MKGDASSPCAEGRPPDLERLRRIMQALRDPLTGCPWDLEQSLDSLRPYLLEECYEVLDVMDGDAAAVHAEELGDLLFQIVFQSQLRAEAGAFELADVVDVISDKLERRHPHVFGDEQAGDATAVAARWDELKREEGKGAVGDVPRSLPALKRAQAVQRKAAKRGFDWPDSAGPTAKLHEELAELEEAAAGLVASTDGSSAGSSEARAAVVHELGDLLFSAVNLARHLEIDAELALGGATDRFLARFGWITDRLSERGLQPEQADLETLDGLWGEAKDALAGQDPRRKGGPGSPNS